MLSGLAAEIVLVDANRAKTEGEAMDLNHAVPFARQTRIWAGDCADCAGAAVTVLTAGAAQRPGESRLELLKKNAALFREQVLDRCGSGASLIAWPSLPGLCLGSRSHPRPVLGAGGAISGRANGLTNGRAGAPPRFTELATMEHGNGNPAPGQGASDRLAWMDSTKRPNEQQLIEAARAGDTGAFDRLARRYQDYLYRLMLRACHHPQDAEEVASEALFRAYQRLSQFEGRSSFVTWLGRIATNLCFRRRERAEPPSASLEEMARDEEGHPDATPPADEPTPEQHALRAEMKRIILAAIAEIPEPDQRVLRLRDIEDLPAAEVSARTGLTVPAVKARLHRARGRLRARLNAYFLGEGA